ncbi:hypothetical protein DDIC_05620 [Desulfovibrio desulfuricans]|uniref:Uncharacterized protein n=1 Tax=Desulfovibrio desulfuricans TaxID=876 RepID=A0A4V1CX87_DESDE|nr:hypothetical protein [Desulfovibrio desulfuricans]QCC85360.1 hypothetical protein DDIC_05620 [Desulfovibrio desulfuricans]
MEKIFVPSQIDLPLDRVFIVAATLSTFKGCRHVDVQIFRPGATDAELEAIKDLGLVAPADPSVPAEVLQGATEEAALRCVLESFTTEESHALVEYLEKRYADQIERITVCPLDLPVPMGVAPLAGIGEGKTTGFIRFDAVRDYPLPFPAYGFYDLAAQKPSAGE